MRTQKRASRARADNAAMGSISLGATSLLLPLERIEYKNRPVIELSGCGDRVHENSNWALGSSIRQPLKYRYPLPR
ncbi:protein of unknown function [Pararobbsia alpina]